MKIFNNSYIQNKPGYGNNYLTTYILIIYMLIYFVEIIVSQ